MRNKFSFRRKWNVVCLRVGSALNRQTTLSLYLKLRSLKVLKFLIYVPNKMSLFSTNVMEKVRLFFICMQNKVRWFLSYTSKNNLIIDGAGIHFSELFPKILNRQRRRVLSQKVVEKLIIDGARIHFRNQ
jgi:hypothetical protein